MRKLGLTLIPDFKKKYLPKYFYNFFVATIVYLVVGIVSLISISLTVGFIYGESVVTYAVMISLFVAFFLVGCIFAIFESKCNNRLIKERAEELENEFTEMPFQDAVRILKERGVINETGFVVKGKDGSSETSVPFESAKLGFNVYHIASQINLNIVLFTEEAKVPIADFIAGSRQDVYKRNSIWNKVFDRECSWKAIYKLDRALYTFVFSKYPKIYSDKYLELLVRDKSAFAKYALYFYKTCKLDIEKYRV